MKSGRRNKAFKCAFGKRTRRYFNFLPRKPNATNAPTFQTIVFKMIGALVALGLVVDCNQSVR
jgi:hypothetical protein